MDTRVALVRDILRSQLPTLSAESIRPLGEGQDHVAYEVGGELVVRFALGAQSDSCAARIAREATLLGVVERISPLAVPQPLFVLPASCCYGYRRLGGVPLLSFAPAARARIASPVAASIGDLLAALHRVPVAELAAVAPRDLQPASQWLQEAAELYARVAAHVSARRDRAIRTFLDTPPHERRDEPVFSHNDLGIEHVLVDPGSGQVTGVIDWSDAAICDRAYDFGLLLRDLGPAALDAALESYATDADLAAVTERAWFCARCAAIEDLSYGLETGRDEYRTKSIEALPWLFEPPL
jgi:aminoglycoside phosphotransferase (APT) family kinase protein